MPVQEPTQEHVNQAIEFAESRGEILYSDSVEIITIFDKSSAEQLPNHISNQLLKGSGAVTSHDNEEIPFKDYIYLYPPRMKVELTLGFGKNKKYLIGRFIQLLFHELRHHVQNIELQDYIEKYFDDYRNSSNRVEHWAEVDADIYAINFMARYEQGLARALNVNRSQLGFRKMEGNLADFNERREYYSSYENNG